MTKYSEIEIETAKRLHDAGYKWLARTMVGNVVAFSYEPHKKEGLWLYSSNSISGKVAFISGNFTPLFQSIKWGDEKPTYIEHIIYPQVLDDAEKRYLSAVIKPIRNEILAIVKHSASNGSEEWLNFVSKKGSFYLSNFKTGTMYKGMKPDHGYSLEELGL